MNILHHKSWHVRTKKNIARVRRDEERARQEEENKLKKIDIAEHEALIAKLRSKKSNNSSEKCSNEKSTSLSESFNLFDNYKDKLSNDLEKSKEKKDDQEKWEVKAGIFSYLDGRHKYESSKNDDWFLKSHEERLGLLDNSADVNYIKNQKSVMLNDPLEDMKRYMSSMKSDETKKTFEDNNRKLYSMNTKSKDQTTKSSLQQKKHLKKNNKKHKRKHKSDSESNSESESKEDLIKRLRTERLQREKKEREKTRLLLNGPSSESQPKEYKNVQKYNSQFNPHIARQNLND